MLKQILFLLIILSIVTSFADTRSNTFTDVIDCDYSNTIISFSADELNLRTFECSNGNFTMVTLDNASPSSEIGYPELPVVRVWIEIPQNCTPSVNIFDIQQEKILLHHLWLPNFVYPRQAPIPKIAGFKSKFTANWNFYLSNNWQFDSPVKILDIVQARDHRLALIEIRPVDYNPVEGKLTFIESAKIQIATPDADISATKMMKRQHRSKYYDEIIGKNIVNSAFYENLWVPSADVHMLIISSSTYTSQLADLVNWKSRKGFKVDLKTASELGGTANSIKNYIQTQYDSDNIDFVLFVGDAADIPAFTGGSSGSSSDNPYSELSGGDYIPDCFVGRLSLTSAAQVSEMVNRIINYEHFSFGTGTNWTKAVCLPASDDGSYHGFAEATQRYVAQNRYTPNGYTRIDTIWAYYSGTGADVINSVNSGVMVANYTGHGYNAGWAGPEVGQSDVQNLTNTGMYPMVISNACQTGMFGEYDECFMETWIRQIGKGAIASLGASDYTYWDEDDEFERRMIDSVFVDEWMFTGGMRFQALLGVYNGYPSSAEYYYDMYNLLGDPSVALWWNAPQSLTVSHPATVTPGDGNIDFNVSSIGSPVENAFVCITNDGTIHSAEYTNSSGNITLSYSSASPGETLWVTATAYNKIPYESFVFVGSNGPYITYNAHTVQDNGGSGSSGDNDGIADAQETIALWVDLQNSGSLNAYGISAIFSSTSPYVNITDNSSNYGTIAVGDTESSADPFIVQLLGTPDDSSVISFNLNITDVAGSTWTSQFDLIVRAPNIVVSNDSLADLGDGDGFFEPGEQVGVSITLRNDSGGDDAINVLGSLTEDDPNISITVADANFGTIAPLGSATNPTLYRVSINSGCPTPYVARVYHTATESRGYTIVDTIALVIGTGGLFDDAESGIAQWIAETPFHITSYRSNLDGHSFYAGIETGLSPFQYADNTNSSLTSANPIILPLNPVLTFWHFYETEYGYDSCFVEASTDDGTNWIGILSFNGPSKGWKFAYANLSPLGSAGDQIYLRFRFNADAGVHNQGWFIDDIAVQSQLNGYIGAGDVMPWAGSADDTFTFKITYASPSDTTPLSATVYIDGTPYTMTDYDGNVPTGRTYYYSTTLAEDSHSYYFVVHTAPQDFRFPSTGTIDGPYVETPHYDYNLGTSNGGFSISSFDYYQDWQWGVPSSGPSSVPIGSGCWATILSGDYSDSSQSRLITPSMTIPDDGTIPYLTILHWYRIQAANTPLKHDGANIKLSVDGGDPFVIFPQCGYDGEASQYNNFTKWQPIWGDTIDNFWQIEPFDLSSWVGHSVRVYFDFGSSSRNTDAGWYINYVRLYTALPTEVINSEKPNLPSSISMNVYPNPFNSSCKIIMNLWERSPDLDYRDREVSPTIEIYDLRGNVVGATQQNGDASHRPYIWTPDATISSGIYLVRAITEDGQTITKRVIYLK